MTGDNGSIRFNIVSTSTLKVVEDSLTVRGGNGGSGAATGPLSFPDGIANIRRRY